MFYQLLISAFCVYVIWKMLYNTKRSNQPPDLSGKFPIIGHTLRLFVNSTGKIKPFMELILELADRNGCFTDEEVREETDTIIGAGYETTSTALCFVLTVLGSYPEIQAKVYDEIIGASGNTDIDLDKDNLSKLVYTEAVLKETLRLYPPAPIIARYADKALKLSNYTLEANSSCILLLQAVNRHPMWGPDADQFRPERWLDAATVPDPNYFSSFSLGRRSCIGRTYAMMSMKIMLAHVVRRFQISADVTKMIFKWEAITKPVSGHEITLELRK